MRVPLARGLAASLVAIATAVALPARAAPGDVELEAAVGRIVDEERARWGTPGMSVAVIRGGRIVAALAAGFADREAGTAMALDTLVPAASISKLLTAVLVMRQVELGRLDLDAPANRYVDEALWIRDAAGHPVDASLRQLLSHNAGLPVEWDGIVSPGHPVPTLEEWLARGQTTIHAPGAHVVYANAGFALAGLIAARAEGQPFAEHAEAVLLRPLGMRDSTFASPWTLSGRKLAAAYGGLFGGSQRGTHDDPTPNAPAGALVSTAPDLARFARMLLGGGELDGIRILRPESVAEMWRIQAKEHPALDEGFGLGFAVRVRPGRRMVWWDGSLRGAANRLALLPEHGAGVVVLSNLSENAASAEAADRILDLLVPPPPPPAYVPEPAALVRAAGQYRPLDLVDPDLWALGLGLAIEFRVREGTLWQESRLTKSSALVPIGPDRFLLPGSMLDGAEVLFDGDDVVVGFFRARRLSPWQTPRAFAATAALVALALLAALAFGAVRAVQALRRARRRAA